MIFGQRCELQQNNISKRNILVFSTLLLLRKDAALEMALPVQFGNVVRYENKIGSVKHLQHALQISFYIYHSNFVLTVSVTVSFV